LQAWQHAPQETRWDFSIVKQFLEADAETSLHRPSPFGTLGSPKGGYTASTYSRSGTRHSRAKPIQATPQTPEGVQPGDRPLHEPAESPQPAAANPDARK